MLSQINVQQARFIFRECDLLAADLKAERAVLAKSRKPADRAFYAERVTFLETMLARTRRTAAELRALLASAEGDPVLYKAMQLRFSGYTWQQIANRIDDYMTADGYRQMVTRYVARWNKAQAKRKK